MTEVEDTRSAASEAGWLVEVTVSVTTDADPAPVVTVRIDTGSSAPSAATAVHVVNGGEFPIAVDLSDPGMVAWDPDAHPALQRKLWRERTIWQPSLLVEPHRIEADGLLALALDGSGRAGYEDQPGDPRRPADATGGGMGAVEGWRMQLLRPAAASFTLSAPAWWGPTGETSGLPDGTVTAAVTLRPATETTTT